MNMLTSLIKQCSVAIFCALTIALTFASTLLPLPGEAVPVVIVFIPAFMAIALTAISEGKTGVRSLLGKLVQLHVSFKWLVIAVALALVMRLTISLLALVLGQEVPAAWPIPAIATAIWTVVFIAIALWRFNREEF